MARYRIKQNDDDEDNFYVIGGRKILRDGRRYRVTDSLPQYDEVRVIDGKGNSGLALQRPGFRAADAGNLSKQMRDEVDVAYRAYDDAIATQYKRPPTGEGSGEFVGQREGDLCTIDGRPGRLVYDDETGELVCMADHPTGKRDTRTIDEIARDHGLRMSEEYDAYARSLTEAWRRP